MPASILPNTIRQAINDTARGLETSLINLSWPNGGKDGAFSEANVTLQFVMALSKIDPNFTFYLEGKVNQRGRMDLMGTNGKIALAMEAKCFGPVGQRLTSIQRDIDRIRTFQPSMAPLEDGQNQEEWWDNAESRIGLILVGNCCSGGLSEAWSAKSVHEARRYLDQVLESAANRSEQKRWSQRHEALLPFLEQHANNERGV